MEKPNSVQEQVETKAEEAVIAQEESSITQEPEKTQEQSVETLPIEESIEVQEETIPPVQPIVAKKADTLIDEARSIIEKSDLTTRNCMEILEEDIEKYEDAKSLLLTKSIHPSEALLKEVGFDSSIEQELDEEEAINFEDIKQIEPIYVRELSSGKFGALILSLLAGLAVIVGWIYVASNALNVVVDPSKVPTTKVQDQILSWIGGGITGGEGNVMIGLVILLVSAIIAIWAVFAVKIFLRESQNYKTAQKVKEDAEFYCTKKEECQKEMKKVSDHINQVITAIDTSKIYINEQNATIERILHIEGDMAFDELHKKSQEEISNTNILINGIKQLLSTPMASENGSLSEDAKIILAKTQKRQETYREKLYS